MTGSRTPSWKSIGASDRGTSSAILRRDSDKTTHNPNEEKSGLKRTLTARIKKEMEDISHRTERLKGAVDGLSKIREARVNHDEHGSGEDSGLDPGEGVPKDPPDSQDGPALSTTQPAQGVPTDDGPTTTKTQAATPAPFEFPAGKGALETIEIGVYQHPRHRHRDLREVLRRHQQHGQSWDVILQEYPDLTVPQTFRTIEDVRKSIPTKIKQERTRTFWLKPGGSSRQRGFLSTTRFFDTGNKVGPLISAKKLVMLGYDVDLHVDKTQRQGFRGATGHVGYTLGAIAIERSLKPDGSDPKPITFQVWDDKVKLADAMFGEDEDSQLEPGEDGFPPLLPNIPVKLTAKEREILESREKRVAEEGCPCCTVM